MADYYTLFSVLVPLRGEEEREWARRVVSLCRRFQERELDLGGEGPEEDPEGILPEGDWLGYQAEVVQEGLLIWAEESGAPEQVVPLLQAYLRRFDPGGCIGFEWARACSKMRPDSFGGGAVLAWAEGAEWASSGRWLAEARARRGAGRRGARRGGGARRTA